jgi:hypothetical protein
MLSCLSILVILPCYHTVCFISAATYFVLLSHVCADADVVFQYIKLNMLAFMLVIEMFQSRHTAAHSYVDPAGYAPYFYSSILLRSV